MQIGDIDAKEMSAPKRSLFNRPAWAAKDTCIKKREPEVFGRHQVYNEVLELEEKRRRSREARTKHKAEIEKLEKDRTSKRTAEEEPRQKRRRISQEPADTGSGSDSDNSESSKRTPDADDVLVQRVTRSTPKTDKKLRDGLEDFPVQLRPSTGSKQEAVVIELGDEDSDSATTQAQSGIKADNKHRTKAPSKPEPESEDSDDDEYMRALKKRAREKSSVQRGHSDQSKAATAFAAGAEARSPSIDTPQPDATLRPSSAHEDTSDPFDPHPDIEDDPEVGILIKSLIPNSKPLIINRKASQPLQAVKDFWCGRQKFEPSFSAKVFLTWREEKLFSSSTMRTVLRLLKKEKGYDPDGVEDPSEGKIVVEAMTEEIYQERRKAREVQRAAKATSEYQTDEEGAQGTPEPPPEQPKKDGTVIKLTSQGLEPMPLRVRPHTSVAKIMRAFQAQRKIAEEKTCWLIFDGDRLEPESSVEQAGFEEGDEVEVHPR